MLIRLLTSGLADGLIDHFGPGVGCSPADFLADLIRRIQHRNINCPQPDYFAHLLEASSSDIIRAPTSE